MLLKSIVDDLLFPPSKDEGYKNELDKLPEFDTMSFFYWTLRVHLQKNYEINKPYVHIMMIVIQHFLMEKKRGGLLKACSDVI